MTSFTGPWAHAFYTDLPTALRSKSNYRHGEKKSAWGTLRNFETVAGLTIARDVPDGWALGSKSDALADRPVVLMVILARSMLDASNFSKSLADAAEGVVVINDASITATTSLGVRARKDPRAAVAFAQLPAGTSLPDQASALAELTAQAVRQFEAG